MSLVISHFPVHLTAVFGRGECFAGQQREAKAWEQAQLAAPGVPAVLAAPHVWEPCPAVWAFLSSLFAFPAHLRLCCGSRGRGWAVSRGTAHPKEHSWSWALPAGPQAGNDCPETTKRAGDQTSPEPTAPSRTGFLSCANTNLVQRLPTPALPSDYKCTRSF